MVESIKKRFLWSGGVPKIAHNSLISTLEEGGINYKDVQTQVSSINIKFMTGLKNCVSNRKWIPLHWIKTFFRKISNIRAIDIKYFNNFIQGTLDIIGSCSFKLPRRSKWESFHQFKN